VVKSNMEEMIIIWSFCFRWFNPKP
jgi:hypothetical protein